MIIFILILINSSYEKIEIKGSKGIFYEIRNFSGSYPQGFYPYSLRQEYLKLNLKGFLRFSTQITGEIIQNSNPLKEDHIFLNLKNPYFFLNIGDHNVFFEENSLLLSKTYNQGATSKIFYKYTEGNLIYTKVKGRNLYKRFRGNNTQGPFYLGYAPLIQESERVRIIKEGRYEDLKRGIDYEIDYFSGNITFLNRVIKKDEIVEVFYQSKEENLNEIYGFRIGSKYFGYSEMNLRNKNLKEGVYGLDFCLPFKYLNLKFEAGFNKYNSRKLGAYRPFGIFEYKDFKLRGYYKKLNGFYKPIESVYFKKGGKEDSLSGNYKWFYFKRYDFKDTTRKEKNYSIGFKFNNFGYEFSENYLNENEKYIFSFNYLYFLKEIKELKINFNIGFGSEKNPFIFEGKRKSYAIRKELKYRKNFINATLNSNYKIAGDYKEFDQKGNFNFSFKNLNLYFKSECFKNSRNIFAFIISSGYNVLFHNFFKIKGFLKREEKFLSDSIGKGIVFTLSNSFDLSFKRINFSPFLNFKELNGKRYYFNYISKGFSFNFSPYKDLPILYIFSEGKSKNSKDKKNNLIVSKNIKNFLTIYEYIYVLNKGRTYLDTLSSNVQRIKANKISLNYIGDKRSIENTITISDSLWIRENKKVSYDEMGGKSKFSKDITSSLSFYTGFGIKKKRGFDDFISIKKIGFYTISPFTGIIGRYKNYLTIEANFEIENSLKRNIHYGKNSLDFILSFNYKKINLSSSLNYKKILSPPYEDLRFTFNGEIKF
jgi:hypothetical protein